MIIEEFLTDGKVKNMSFIYTNYGNNTLSVEGIKDLISSTDECIILKMKKGEINVKGKNLIVSELGKNTIVICGNIISIES